MKRKIFQVLAMVLLIVGATFGCAGNHDEQLNMADYVDNSYTPGIYAKYMEIIKNAKNLQDNVPR